MRINVSSCPGARRDKASGGSNGDDGPDSTTIESIACSSSSLFSSATPYDGGDTDFDDEIDSFGSVGEAIGYAFIWVGGVPCEMWSMASPCISVRRELQTCDQDGRGDVVVEFFAVGWSLNGCGKER